MVFGKSHPATGDVELVENADGKISPDLAPLGHHQSNVDSHNENIGNHGHTSYDLPDDEYVVTYKTWLVVVVMLPANSSKKPKLTYLTRSCPCHMVPLSGLFRPSALSKRPSPLGLERPAPQTTSMLSTPLEDRLLS